jgi:hypothetical protein
MLADAGSSIVQRVHGEAGSDPRAAYPPFLTGAESIGGEFHGRVGYTRIKRQGARRIRSHPALCLLMRGILRRQVIGHHLPARTIQRKPLNLSLIRVSYGATNTHLLHHRDMLVWLFPEFTSHNFIQG